MLPDHHLVTGGIPMLGFPVLGGHEGAGIVTEVGAGVDSVAPGDHVVMSFIPSCGKCPSCQAGLRTWKTWVPGYSAKVAIADGTHRITAKGQPVFPMTLLGTFSPYMVVHESSVVKIDPSIPFEVACLVGCGVTTGWGSATHTAQIKPGEDVAVVGVGGVGMAALQGGELRSAQHLRHRTGGVEARRRTEVRRNSRLLRGHQRSPDGYRRRDRRVHGQEGDRHRRTAGLRHRELHDDHLEVGDLRGHGDRQDAVWSTPT